MDYFLDEQQRRRDRQALRGMALLGGVAVLVVIAALVVLLLPKTPSVSRGAENLTMTPKELRDKLTQSLQSLGMTVKPQHLLIDTLSFHDDWVFVRATVTDRPLRSAERQLYLISKRQDDGVTVKTFATRDQAWLPADHSVPQDIQRKAEEVIWLDV